MTNTNTTKTYKNSKNIFEIVIRPTLKIRSRQWWIKKTKEISRILKKNLPKKGVHYSKSFQSTLLLTNNKEIQNLNKKHRNLNKPTDVLSFHLNKKEQICLKYLGDIIISVEKAKKQAIEQNKTLEEELFMLIIHGFLHLIGYDHQKVKERKIMFSLQNKLLKKIKVN